MAKILPRSVDLVPESRFEFTCIDIAVTSLLANQPLASESERPRDQCLRAGQSAFFVRVTHPQTFSSLYCCRQLTVSIVISAIFVIRLVDSILSGSLHIVR